MSISFLKITVNLPPGKSILNFKHGSQWLKTKAARFIKVWDIQQFLIFQQNTCELQADFARVFPQWPVSPAECSISSIPCQEDNTMKTPSLLVLPLKYLFKPGILCIQSAPISWVCSLGHSATGMPWAALLSTLCVATAAVQASLFSHAILVKASSFSSLLSPCPNSLSCDATDLCCLHNSTCGCSQEWVYHLKGIWQYLETFVFVTTEGQRL